MNLLFMMSRHDSVGPSGWLKDSSQPANNFEYCSTGMLLTLTAMSQATRHAGIDMAFDALPAPHYDGQVPFRQLARLERKVQEGALARLSVQREHHALQTRSGYVRRHVRSHTPVCGQNGPPLHEILGGSARRRQGAFFTEK